MSVHALGLVISDSSSAHLCWLQRPVVQKIYDWQINIQWLVEPSLWTWLRTKQSAVFSQGSLAYDGVLSNWVWLQRDHQCWRHSRNDNMTPHCNLDLEDSKTFSHLTLAHNNAFPYYVWSQKVKSFRKYHPGKQSMIFWTFAVTLTLTLKTAKHTFHKTLGGCLSCWCITVPCSVPTVSAVQKVPSGQTLNWILNHYCDLDLLHNNSTFWKYV